MRVFGCMNRLFVFYAGRVFFIFKIYVNDFKNDFFVAIWQTIIVYLYCECWFYLNSHIPDLLLLFTVSPNI